LDAAQAFSKVKALGISIQATLPAQGDVSPHDLCMDAMLGIAVFLRLLFPAVLLTLAWCAFVCGEALLRMVPAARAKAEDAPALAVSVAKVRSDVAGYAKGAAAEPAPEVANVWLKVEWTVARSSRLTLPVIRTMRRRPPRLRRGVSLDGLIL
jgi:hypothetical protein